MLTQLGLTTSSSWVAKVARPLLRTGRIGGLILLATLPYNRFDDLAFTGLQALVCLALFLPVLVFVHELGHAAAARQAGARVRGMSIGPFKVDLRGGAKAYLSSYRPDGGQVILSLEDRAIEAQAMRSISLAGPLVNLTLAAASYLALTLSTPAWPAALLAALFVFSAANAAIGLLNLVPTFERGLFFTDGDSILKFSGAERDTSALAIGVFSNLMADGELSPAVLARVKAQALGRDVNSYLFALALYQSSQGQGDLRQAAYYASQMVQASAELPEAQQDLAHAYAALARPNLTGPQLQAVMHRCTKAGTRLLKAQGTWQLLQMRLAQQLGQAGEAEHYRREGLRQAQNYQRSTLSKINAYELSALSAPA
ncbi:hypothetical protein GCM10017783_17260 [Deinococcus piscis]|uniref:Peptidase M50 domain-containing protein n=1 Tax=Deinococcus piscis TaxID=394230 RepID=A0ABQ3K6A5_9DEIO|nr:site-2 protease family protein [Deinococcus piscis]GHG05263.1 hypothetical protein GCM10017783_17260 [Deinococcus piscis]